MAESRNSSAPPLGSIVLILLFAAGVYVQQFHLHSARPDSAETKRNRFVGIQDVKARLWQDPFEAVARHREAAGTPAPADPQSDSFHEVASAQAFLSGKAKDNGKGVVILGAMVFGGPYADDAEQRRRQRYAILSGLEMQGYEPADSDNIGFFMAPSEGAAPAAVPFEWLQHVDRQKGILLLWLEEDSYAAPTVKPLDKLKKVIDSLDPDPPGKPPRKPGEKIPLKILGPASSGGLDRLGQELRDGTQLRTPSGLVGRPIEIYSATATAGDQYIPGLRDFTRMENIPLLRTISTDEQLAAEIGRELALRGAEHVCEIDEEHRDYVVLVSEWDTDYGKQLPIQIEEALGCGPGKAAVVRRSYLRGLDGKTSGGSAKMDKEGARPEDDKNGAGKINSERADGNSQTDYVRRLANDLRDLDARLRAGKRGRVKAVGVLGSDFYDKLVLLQALRPEFPNAVFFTTDLDARYLSSEQYRWTRNLIVASSFGLQLAPGLQGRIPPFRDVYQTSAFLATRLAFDPSLEGRIAEKRTLAQRWSAAPRIFEIGRTAAFDLTPALASADTGPPPAPCTESLTAKGLDKCADVHPERRALRLTTREKFLLVAAIVAFVGALAAYSRGLRRVVGRRRPALLLLALLLLMVFGFESFVHFLTRGGAGEPFAWLEGISIWPSVFIRVFAAILCLWFIRRAIRNFKITRRVLLSEFRLPLARATTAGGARANGTGRWSGLRKWADAYLWPPQQRSRTAPVDVTELWEQYRLRAGCRRRFWRVAPVAALFFIFGIATILLFGEPPVPYRGEFSLFVERASLLVILLFVFLLFLVVDATMLCRTFILHLQKTGSDWPDSTIARFEQETGIQDCSDRKHGNWAGILSDWIDVRYIARYTQEVSALIWYPFIIIALLVAARSSLFDNWQLPAGLALVVLASITYATACAVILQFTAAKAREIALSNMREKLVWAKGGSPELAGQIDTLMGSIANLRQGAFRPISEQPLVRAVLVTLSSYGGISIAEYLALLPR